MTREEAIEWMVFQKEQVLAMSGDKPGTLTVAYDMAIEALDERKVELFDDGTLVVNVKEGEKVGRVLIEGDDHFGGLYYIDDRQKGEWVEKDDGVRYWWHECSECGAKPPLNRWNKQDELSNFCPNCGAKMDKDCGERKEP